MSWDIPNNNYYELNVCVPSEFINTEALTPKVAIFGDRAFPDVVLDRWSHKGERPWSGRISDTMERNRTRILCLHTPRTQHTVNMLLSYKAGRNLFENVIMWHPALGPPASRLCEKKFFFSSLWYLL